MHLGFAFQIMSIDIILLVCNHVILFSDMFNLHFAH